LADDNREALQLIKRPLVRVGSRLPPRAHYHLSAVVDYLHLGRWMRERGHRPPRYRNRSELFERLGEVCGSERVLYLEFGVAEGGSMRNWSRLLRNPESQLHGFDSFEGLPTDWILTRPAGYFSLSGVAPRFDDPRVELHQGWFSETLPSFAWPSGWERLVANFDADLYSSTTEALSFIAARVTPGTIMYFDEFNHRADELRAFDEFLARTRIRVRALGAVADFSQVAFETL
jgi:macrocin-O-methyltransferase TylF-like protien